MIEKVALIRHKIERATKNLADLEIEAPRFIAADAYEVESYEDAQTGNSISKMRYVNVVPDKIASTVDDILRDTRSALDDLAHQLVIANGGYFSADTSFPIFDSAEACVAMNIGSIQGMSQAAKDKIRATEPYKEGKGDYLWVLDKLDNASKNQGLLIGIGLVDVIMPSGVSLLSPRGGLPVPVTIKYGEPLKAGEVFFALPKNHPYHDLRFTFDIRLSEPSVDGSTSLKGIAKIIEITDSVILDFEPLLA